MKKSNLVYLLVLTLIVSCQEKPNTQKNTETLTMQIKKNNESNTLQN